MTSFRHELPVAAPPEAAWAVLCDVDGYAAWVAHTLRMVSSSGGATVGGRYREWSRLLGPLGWPTDWRIVAVDDGQRQVHVGGGLPIVERMVATFDVAPDPAGCRVGFTLETVPRGAIGRAALAVLRPLLRRRQVRSVERLVARIDARD